MSVSQQMTWDFVHRFNWTQDRIADAIGTTQPNVSRILNQGGEFSAATYQRLVDAHKAEEAKYKRRVRRAERALGRRSP